MKSIYQLLKFKLGSESYDFEHELIPIPPYEILRNNLALEPYEFFGDNLIIGNLKSSKIVLYYNADVLMKVEIYFKGDGVKYIKELINKGNYQLPTNMFLKIYLDEIGMTVISYESKLLQIK